MATETGKGQCGPLTFDIKGKEGKIMADMTGEQVLWFFIAFGTSLYALLPVLWVANAIVEWREKRRNAIKVTSEAANAVQTLPKVATYKLERSGIPLVDATLELSKDMDKAPDKYAEFRERALRGMSNHVGRGNGKTE